MKLENKEKQNLRKAYLGDRASKIEVSAITSACSSKLDLRKNYASNSSKRKFFVSMVSGAFASILAFVFFLLKNENDEILKQKIEIAFNEPELLEFDDTISEKAEMFLDLELIYHLKWLKKWRS